MGLRSIEESETGPATTPPPPSGIRRAARVDLMGCHFDPITQNQTLDLVFAWRREPTRKTRTIVTVNVAILMMMRDDAELRQSVAAADVVVVDGTPLVWTSRWLRSAVPEKVSGVDLMERLLAVGGDRNLSVYLLGTTQERLDALQRVILEKYPKVTIVGARNGYFRPEEYPEVIRGIREARADVLLVGMPAPFKEIWCEEHRDALATPVILGVGGAFDVIGGFVRRAPHLLQRAGLEWAWRLAMEPRKLWRRYVVTNTRFLTLLPWAIAERRRLAKRVFMAERK